MTPKSLPQLLLASLVVWLCFLSAPAQSQVSILGTPELTEGTDEPDDYPVSAGSNRKLLVCAQFQKDLAVMTGLTYGTVAMTQVMYSGQSGDNSHAYLWELDDAGIVTAEAISTVFAASYTLTPGFDRMSQIVWVLQDTDQSVGAAATAIELTHADPITVDITGVADSYGVACVRTSLTTQTWGWGNSWLETDETVSITASDDSYATKALSAGTETASANPTGTGNNYIIAARFDPVASSSVVPQAYYLENN